MRFMKSDQVCTCGLAKIARVDARRAERLRAAPPLSSLRFALIVSHIFLAGHWAPQRASFGCDGRLRTEFYGAIAESFA